MAALSVDILRDGNATVMPSCAARCSKTSRKFAVGGYAAGHEERGGIAFAGGGEGLGRQRHRSIRAGMMR